MTCLLPLRARSQASQLPQSLQPAANLWGAACWRGITHLYRLIQAFASKLAQSSAMRRDLVGGSLLAMRPVWITHFHRLIEVSLRA
jgi:hypothetical protein